MHKKLENDLMSLAHSILQMKNKEDVFALKEKSQAIYEKLSLLAFVEEYVNVTPNIEETKEELIATIVNASEVKDATINNYEIEEDKTITNEKEDQLPQKEDESLEIGAEKLIAEIGNGFDNEDIEATLKVEEQLEEKLEPEVPKEHLELEDKIEIEEQPFDALEDLIFGDTETTNTKDESKDKVERKIPTLEEELKDTISVDVMANMFENAKPTSLNDKLQTNIQIDLNDRIVFVKNLFEGSQEDFNRVVSQLNTHKTEKEAKKFINKIVRPDYNWSNHEELETRFMEIIERRFA